MKSKGKTIGIIVIVILVIIIIAGVAGGNESKEENSNQNQSTTTVENESTAADTQSSNNMKLAHGELLDLTTNDGITVIKAKISPSGNNEMTIKQNYYNVDDYIKNNDMNGIEEIQYWAVADMTDGKESKVISFTVPKSLIEKLQNKSVVASELGDYVTDLWILPSLKK